jgi:hypothetical protein
VIRFIAVIDAAEVIAHAVWLYFRFPLSLRVVEDMLAARGIIVSHQMGALKIDQHYRALTANRPAAILRCGLTSRQPPFRSKVGQVRSAGDLIKIKQFAIFIG